MSFNHLAVISEVMSLNSGPRNIRRQSECRLDTLRSSHDKTFHAFLPETKHSTSLPFFKYHDQFVSYLLLQETKQVLNICKNFANETTGGRPD